MGAQAAALLDGTGPVGDVPAHPYASGGLRLEAPASYGLRTVLLHGLVGLAPFAWDGAALHLRLPDPVVVLPDLEVRWDGAAPDLVLLRHVLGLDEDLADLWAACDRVPELAGLRPYVLRSPTVWQDLVTTLAAVRASYRSTQAMVGSLVGDGPFPEPSAVAGADLSRWGFRAPWLRGLAGRVLDGWDPSALRDPALADDEVVRALRELPGLGPFSCAQLMPLLGRPRPLVLDGWLGARVGDVSRFGAMGRWAGTGAWLSVVAHRLRPGSAR